MKKRYIIAEAIIVIAFVGFIEVVLKLQLFDWQLWVLVILFLLQATISYIEGISDDLSS